MKRIFISIIFVLTTIQLSAHPHIMLITNLAFEYSGEVCRGVWVNWEFDKFFSSMIIQDYDADQNGSFSTEEIKEIHDHAFINLKDTDTSFPFAKVTAGKVRNLWKILPPVRKTVNSFTSFLSLLATLTVIIFIFPYLIQPITAPLNTRIIPFPLNREKEFVRISN